MCVASPRDSSAATAHVCLGSNRGSLSPSPPPPHLEKKTQPYTGYLVLLPWRWGVLVIGAHAVTARETVGFMSPKLGKEGHNYLLLL